MRISAVAAVLVGCVGCDQATKRVATMLLPDGHRVSLLSGLIRLEHVRNPGAFLSLGAGLPDRWRILLFTWGVGIFVVAALFTALRRGTSRRTALAASLVAGGGLGNLWDRTVNAGLVDDFLNVGIGSLRSGIFNVADLAIVAGAILLAFTSEREADPSA